MARPLGNLPQSPSLTLAFSVSLFLTPASGSPITKKTLHVLFHILENKNTVGTPTAPAPRFIHMIFLFL